ncbi:beta-lactamase family protein [Flavobacteriaceae bacterium TP-CH-4]|uniref:Beta-lactamase family protein n=1 Tax=Pelagihabitans pacificus TaxID=2696054 RepID=A0A967AUM8_9FLAO|nr:serine hydrolase domain-containing protein [Pelagihabitans pacificus]NHF60696.1 beta-lactamase family protein [Pelagihabitans pacificus]
MKKVPLVTLLTLCFQMLIAQGIDSLGLQLQKIVDTTEIPGFAVAVVGKDRILYKKGFGFADVEQGIPYTDKTIHNIGSTTKTLIAFSLMKLVDEGKISLDDPINKYLPFKVVHPSFPESDITIRQLATHTSSLTDGVDDLLIEKSYLFHGPINFKKEELPEDYFDYFEIYQTNHAVSMSEFLKNIYTPEGAWYESSNFLEVSPGTAYHYTNIGATLLAFIIEQVSLTDFAEYTKQILFGPLNMSHSFWALDAVPKDVLASLYLSNGLKIPHYELITYPDGGLFTNISDFSVYLMEMIKGINGESSLLSTTWYTEMMQNQLTGKNFPKGSFETSKGLMWSVNPEGDNISVNGADPGVMSYTLFTTQGNVGIVIFMNKTIYDNEELESAFKAIRATLFQNAGKLMKR